MSKISILNAKKIPTSRQNYVGVEIEFLSPWTRVNIKKALISANLHHFVTIKNDGSVSRHMDDCLGFNCVCPMGDAHEITLLSSQNELEYNLILLKSVLNKIRAWTNESCGLHVHIDMRQRDMKKSVDRLLKQQNRMRKMVHPERLVNEYCRPLLKYETNMAEFDDRYKDINIVAYKKFGTVEIRLHEGTIDTSDIYNWCRYLINIVDGKNWSKAYVKRKTKRNKSILKKLRSSDREPSVELLYFDR